MSDGSLTKDQLLQQFADAYEGIIAAATTAAQRGVTANQDGWGPREIITHLAGWERIASVRVPASLVEWRPSSLGILPRTT